LGERRSTRFRLESLRTEWQVVTLIFLDASDGSIPHIFLYEPLLRIH
jgi:hypothetical protein